MIDGENRMFQVDGWLEAGRDVTNAEDGGAGPCWSYLFFVTRCRLTPQKVGRKNVTEQIEEVGDAEKGRREEKRGKGNKLVLLEREEGRRPQDKGRGFWRSEREVGKRRKKKKRREKSGPGLVCGGGQRWRGLGGACERRGGGGVGSGWMDFFQVSWVVDGSWPSGCCSVMGVPFNALEQRDRRAKGILKGASERWARKA